MGGEGRGSYATAEEVTFFFLSFLDMRRSIPRAQAVFFSGWYAQEHPPVERSLQKGKKWDIFWFKLIEERLVLL